MPQLTRDMEDEVVRSKSNLILGLLWAWTTIPAQGAYASGLDTRGEFLERFIPQSRLCEPYQSTISPVSANVSRNKKYYLYSVDAKTWPVIEFIYTSFRPYSSTVSTSRQINCDNRLYRVLGTAESPETLKFDRMSPWMFVPPHTAISDIVDFACKDPG